MNQANYTIPFLFLMEESGEWYGNHEDTLFGSELTFLNK